MSPHDSHYVVVSKKGLPEVPSTSRQSYDEYVIDQESQVLPCYVLFARKL